MSDSTKAPGLTLADLDGLLRDHYRKGWLAGREEARQEGYIVGHAEGSGEAWARARKVVSEVIGGRLIHVVLGLTDTANRRKKTTIAAEREWMASKAADTQAAIDRLRREFGA